MAKTASDREIVVSRIVGAPRELVFEAFTDPNRIANWWGPNGFTTTTYERNVRVGGRWRFMMHGPDGTDYPNLIVYREIVAPERLIYDHSSGDDDPAHEFEASVTFKAAGKAKTRVTLRLLFAKREVRDAMIKFGAEAGGQQTLARLDADLADETSLAMSRVIDAPPETVFKLYTDCAHIKRWWGPWGITTTKCRIDLKPGGVFETHMQDGEGNKYPVLGRVEVVEQPSRFVFSSPLGIPERPESRMQSDIRLEPREGATRVLVHCAHASKADREVHEKMGFHPGWDLAFERFAAEAAIAAGRAFTLERTFNAPRSLVWKAHSQGEHLKAWWGPKGFEMFKLTLDFRPGGAFHYGMRTPQGQEMWGKMSYREIVPEERIVQVTSFSDAEGGLTRHFASEAWPLQMLSIATFTETKGKTKLSLTFLPLFASAAERQTFADGFRSMQGGFGATYDALDAHLATLRDTAPS